MNSLSSTKWLINKLEALIRDLPEIAVRYEYIEEINGHFVEVIPPSVIATEKYLNLEEEIYRDFISLYPTEGLSFQTEDAIVPLNEQNICFEKAGYSYYNYYDNIKMNINIVNQKSDEIYRPNRVIVVNQISEIIDIKAFEKHTDRKFITNCFNAIDYRMRVEKTDLLTEYQFAA